MTTKDPDDRPDCCFDDWAASNARRARSKETVAGTSKALLSALSDDLEGRTLLDVGCGVGDLMLAMLSHGASSGTGMDLGPGGIEEARKLAGSRDLSDRATFVVGDGSREPLEPADIVTLNRVLCCYPNADDLIENTTGAARSLFAFTAPVDRGLAGVYNRMMVWSANHWYALRRRKFRGFRVFVHDLEEVERTIRAAGFELAHAGRVRWTWRLAVFEKT